VTHCPSSISWPEAIVLVAALLVVGLIMREFIKAVGGL
jgi:hypothetical protein